MIKKTENQTCMVTDAFITIRENDIEEEYMIDITNANVLNSSEIYELINGMIEEKKSDNHRKDTGILDFGDYMYVDCECISDEGYEKKFESFLQNIIAHAEESDGTCITLILGKISPMMLKMIYLLIQEKVANLSDVFEGSKVKVVHASESKPGERSICENEEVDCIIACFIKEKDF